MIMESTSEVKLYKSSQHTGQWIAYARGIGWVIFPARANGWEERRNARGLDPMHLREVPLWHALDTGITAAFRDGEEGKAA
jgi:hypothetical protein